MSLGKTEHKARKTPKIALFGMGNGRKSTLRPGKKVQNGDFAGLLKTKMCVLGSVG
jgi:hypothetical protein